jgi:inner membrane protein
MPSFFGHALAGYAIGSAFHRGRPGRRMALLSVACATAPDLDWFTGFLDPGDRFGLGHRGLLHSLLAAGILTILAMTLANRDQARRLRPWLCLGAATFSHGMLDAITFGGTGVAFLEPFSSTHFVAAWQPIFVAPIPLSGHLAQWLAFSLGTEALWIGLPALALILGSRFLRNPEPGAEEV